MSVTEAAVFAGITGLFWNGHDVIFNFQSAMVSLFFIVLYGFIYTPRKKNLIFGGVLVGAVPGALPCLDRWVAATTTSAREADTVWDSVLWQFLHFGHSLGCAYRLQ